MATGTSQVATSLRVASTGDERWFLDESVAVAEDSSVYILRYSCPVYCSLKDCPNWAMSQQGSPHHKFLAQCFEFSVYPKMSKTI